MSEYIKEKLKSKLQEVLWTCYNEELKELIATKTYFAGGAVRDLHRNTSPKDYDMYFVDQASVTRFFELVVNEPYLKKTRINNYKHTPSKTQLITLIAGAPADVVKQFDFTINTGFYVPSTDELVLGDEGNKLAVCEKILSPMNALARVKKFVDKGYEVDTECLIGLGIQVSEMDPIDTKDKLDDALKGISAGVNYDKL